ncbi:insulinase family protein [Saccharospirillum mangrovi]|uniref:insulinase family protein n=1 Tax=Saccharospirillum mangrovi TaxID=2161747 RepID=UPI000D3D8F18|nr:insulinase family protein [Saccharospirillum mangrovi]
MNRGVRVAIAVGVVAALAGVGLWYSQVFAQRNPSNIVVSDFESRHFDAYRLSNGMKVLLVSDADSEQAAAALNVTVGSWSNPPEVPGLAHLLEHVLFLGTEKYPEVDSYHRFIEQGGGTNNAYTADENTLYFFDIDADQLEPALDRFAQFFIAPLFDADFIEREIQAVHSEFTASLQNDSRRREDVLSELYLRDHPASRLAIGNDDTLDVPDLRDQLMRFYRQHYVAGRMALTVYGPQDIDTLKAWVDARFGGVRSVDSDAPVFDQPYFEDADLPFLVEIQPRRESRLLQLRFPVPGNEDELDTKPDDFIAYLLGQETKGSLISELKARGWAEALSARPGNTTASQHQFSLTVQLTETGLENWEAVAGLAFEYLQLIGEQGLEEWRYDELADIQRINFEFAEHVSPAATVQSLAERLSIYPPKEALRGPYRFNDFDDDTLREWLGYLKPDNALVVLMHPDAPAKVRSRWYNTPYSLTPLAGNTLAAWRNPQTVATLKLPDANPFVPTNLDVLPLTAPTSSLYRNQPQVIRNAPGYELWFEQDDEFRTPKLDVSLLIETPDARATARDRVMTQLYLDLVDDSLSEFRYAAGLAGSGYGLSTNERGMHLRLYGFSQPLPTLFDTLLVELAEHSIDPDRFERLKADLARRLRNTDEDPVVNQLFRRLSQFLIRDAQTPEALSKALADVTPADINAWRDRWLANHRITMLVHGNLTQEDAIELGDRARLMLPPSASTAPVEPQIAAMAGRRYRHELSVDHNDSALLGYYQGSNSSLRERALYALAGQILNAPYFAELRTQEQLGYVVFARAHSVHDWPGLVVYIQSPSTDPALLQLYSDRFMTRFAQRLRSMSEAEFRGFKQGLETNLTTPADNLYELSQQYWSAILDDNPNFNTGQRLAGEVENISQDGFVRFFETQFLAEGSRRLMLHQVGEGMASDYDEHGQGLVGFYPADGPADMQRDARWVTPTFNNLPPR